MMPGKPAGCTWLLRERTGVVAVVVAVGKWTTLFVVHLSTVLSLIDRQLYQLPSKARPLLQKNIYTIALIMYNAFVG